MNPVAYYAATTLASMFLVAPGYQYPQCKDEVFESPLMMNTTGLINEAQFQAGSMNVSKNLVYKRGYPNQRAIPSEV